MKTKSKKTKAKFREFVQHFPGVFTEYMEKESTRSETTQHDDGKGMVGSVRTRVTYYTGAKVIGFYETYSGGIMRYIRCD